VIYFYSARTTTGNTMTGELFLKWIKGQLIPALAQIQKKCVVIMDNAPYHFG
jgi:hypothetical protein